jgi:hypothetical protein
MKISFNHPLLVVDISDYKIGATTIKRKAELNFLLYQPRDKMLTISVQVVPYAADEKNAYSDRLDDGANFKSIEKTFTAKPGVNLVDVSTGMYICDPADEFTVDEKGNAVLNPLLVDKNYADEFDFYDHLANASPVIINDLIKNFVLLADSQGRFNKA